MINEKAIKKLEELIKAKKFKLSDKWVFGTKEKKSIDDDWYLVDKKFPIGHSGYVYKKGLIHVKLEVKEDKDLSIKDKKRLIDILQKALTEINLFEKHYTNVIFKQEKVDGEMVYIASDFSKDRDGDRLNPNGWVLDNFLKNPVLLEAHNYSLPAIGKVKKIWVEDGKLKFIPEFAPTERGKEFKTLYENGFMTAWSVGFIPIDYKETDDGYVFTSQELLEISAVSVPANPNAVRDTKIIDNVNLMSKLFKEDINYLNKELDYIKNEIKELKELKEKLNSIILKFELKEKLSEILKR